MGVGILLLGLVIFFAVHSVSLINASWRDRMVDKMGEWPWKGLYSIVSIVGFVLIVLGYGLARQDPLLLYVLPGWMRHVSLLLLLPVFPLLLAAYLPGRIQQATKHPMLVAIKLWALAHLLVNGMLGDVLLFGAFLAWAVLDRISMRHRTQHPGLSLPPSGANDLIAVIAGIGLYVAFIFGVHTWLIGVSPIGH